MWYAVLRWLAAGALLAIALIVINVLLLFSSLGNLKRIFFIRKLISVLQGVPDDILLACQDREVVAMGYDRESNKEQIIPVYTGIITWSGGPRLTRRVRE